MDIRVEVVLALPEEQKLVVVDLPDSATASEAVEKSLIQNEFPQLDVASMALAVWGKPVDRSRMLSDGDRVEILRPLEIEPRDARRKLAQSGQFMGSKALRPAG